MTPTGNMTPGARVAAAVRAHTFAFGDEDQLQEALAHALIDAGFAVELLNPQGVS